MHASGLGFEIRVQHPESNGKDESELCLHSSPGRRRSQNNPPFSIGLEHLLPRSEQDGLAPRVMLLLGIKWFKDELAGMYLVGGFTVECDPIQDG